MRLLLVEDEPGLTDALYSVFTRENFAVDIAGDGYTGLHNALTGIYDIILLDIMLPEISGYQILQEIRNARISTPVIILTAKSELEDKLMGFKNGTDDYVTKPFSTKELIARVYAVVKRNGSIAEPDPAFGDLTLKTRQGLIHCSATGQQVSLAPKELFLLEILLKDPRQCFAKDQLSDKIWGFDNNYEYNNVEVYVSFVRKKLKFIGSQVRIKATRGIGYSLEYEYD